MNAQDGIDSIRDVLFSEENEHVYRMLRCLDKYLDPHGGYELPFSGEVIEAVQELLRMNIDKKGGKKRSG